MLRLALFTAALCCATARAGDPAECSEAFAECKEDCTMAFGTSMADATRKKLGRCLDTCTTTDTDCRDRIRDLNNIQLDDPAVTKGSSAPKREAPLATRAQREADERLEDTPREAPKEKPAGAKVEQPAPARRELRDDEVAKSTRSEVKVVEKKAEPDAPPARDSAQKPVSTEKPAPVRAEADKPAPREHKPQPTAAPEKKKADKPRALDEWDPSAL